MTDEEISKYRSEVIEETINIEIMMNCVITQHYFEHMNVHFFQEVLADETFSFGLRHRILKKIVETFDGKKDQKFHRLNNIRNIFAHSTAIWIEASEFEKGGREPKALNPRNFDKEIDFTALYEEFVSIKDELLEYLHSLYLEKGGTPPIE
ncbi:MAG: hypothetical protein GY797_21845 [Deltaproteobacteria bacterium]|nr:hypothetical protein [Deltaproteobacteria bacterium]